MPRRVTSTKAKSKKAARIVQQKNQLLVQERPMVIPMMQSFINLVTGLNHQQNHRDTPLPATNEEVDSGNHGDETAITENHTASKTTTTISDATPQETESETMDSDPQEMNELDSNQSNLESNPDEVDDDHQFNTDEAEYTPDDDDDEDDDYIDAGVSHSRRNQSTGHTSTLKEISSRTRPTRSLTTPKGIKAESSNPLFELDSEANLSDNPSYFELEEHEQEMHLRVLEKLEEIESSLGENNIESILKLPVPDKYESYFAHVKNTKSQFQTLRSVATTTDFINESQKHMYWHNKMIANEDFYKAISGLFVAYVLSCNDLDAPLLGVDNGNDILMKYTLKVIVAAKDSKDCDNLMCMINYWATEAIKEGLEMESATCIIPDAYEFDHSTNILDRKADVILRMHSYGNIMALFLSIANIVLLGNEGAGKAFDEYTKRNQCFVRRFLTAAFNPKSIDNKKSWYCMKHRSSARAMCHLAYAPILKDPLFKDPYSNLESHCKNKLEFCNLIIKTVAQSLIASSLFANVIIHIMGSSFSRQRCNLVIDRTGKEDLQFTKAKLDILNKKEINEVRQKQILQLFQWLQKEFPVAEKVSEQIATGFGTDLIVSLLLRQFIAPKSTFCQSLKVLKEATKASSINRSSAKRKFEQSDAAEPVGAKTGNWDPHNENVKTGGSFMQVFTEVAFKTLAAVCSDSEAEGLEKGGFKKMVYNHFRNDGDKEYMTKWMKMFYNSMKVTIDTFKRSAVFDMFTRLFDSALQHYADGDLTMTPSILFRIAANSLNDDARITEIEAEYEADLKACKRCIENCKGDVKETLTLAKKTPQFYIKFFTDDDPVYHMFSTFIDIGLTHM
ncbi:hypothetical protein MPSEU_000345100 [Mayamaea pseudoterrestris]|nr:hypothetical protein MPSEU_000345100 [Mayamaea pseudoterrestris]